MARPELHGRGDDVETEADKARAQHEAPVARLALQQAFVLQHAHDAMDRGLGDAKQKAEFGDAQRAARARHRFEDRDRLDGGIGARCVLRPRRARLGGQVAGAVGGVPGHGLYQNPEQNILQYGFCWLIIYDRVASKGPNGRKEKPVRRVLIANRGEIALRAARACRRLGLESVAVHSTADANSPHVWAADHAVCIGPPPASASYLHAPALIETASVLKCDAVYPGYGFLSEKSDFAAKCRAAGLTVIGPSEEAIACMGDKVAARQMAQ